MFKQKFLRIGAFALFLFVWLGLVSPVFAAEAVSLADIQFGVTVAPKPGSSNTFHAFGILQKPTAVRVTSPETTVSLSSTQTDRITGIGYGLLRKSQVGTRCQQQAGNWFCDFPLTYKSSDSKFSKSEPLKIDIQLSETDVELLGFANKDAIREDSIVAIPYVNFQNNPSPALYSSQAAFVVFPENVVAASSTPNKDVAFRAANQSGQVLANYTPAQVKFKLTFLTTNFYRISNEELSGGKKLEVKAAVALVNPDTLDISGVDEINGYDTQGIKLAAVNTNEQPSRCANVPNDPCDAQYISDTTKNLVMTKGRDFPITLYLGRQEVDKLNLKGSDAGTLNKITVVPRIEHTALVDNLDFIDAANTLFIQIYTTTKQAADASGQPAPPGVTPNNPTEGTAREDESLITSKLIQAINSIIAAIIGLIQEILVWIFSWTVGPFIEAMLSIRTYTDKFADVIYPAWQIFRNLGNIFFILIMVAIGLGTVFRVGGWQAKDLLVKLILGAIFINFSLLIAQSILGIADTIQNQFLPNNTGAIRLLADQLIGSKTLSDDLSQLPASAFGTFGETVRLFVLLIVSFAAFAAFVGIAGLLLIRVVFLWLLLMLSPLPYIAMVLPMTKKISQRWWSNFIKYAFMTPAAAFMLNLTALIADKQRDVIQRLSEGAVSNADGLIRLAYAAGGTDPQIVKVMYAVASNAVLIVFMFMALKVGAAFGAESGGLIEKMNKKTMSAATWLPRKAGDQAKAVGKSATENISDRFNTFRNNLASKYEPNWSQQKGLKGKILGAPQRAVFNALSGGAYSEAKKAERKANLEASKENLKATTKDYRNALKGKPQNAVERLNLARRAKSVKEVEDQIKEEDDSKNAPQFNEALNKLSGAAREHEAEAWLKKALSDKNFPKLIEEVTGNANAPIEDFLEALNTKMGNNDQSRAMVKRWAKMINSNQADAGKLQYVTDPDNFTDPVANRAKRKDLWSSKTPGEMAKIDKSMYRAVDPATGTPRVSDFLVQFSTNFDNNRDAKNLRNNMKPANRAEFKAILNDPALLADLRTKLTAEFGARPGATPATTTAQVNTVVTQLQSTF